MVRQQSYVPITLTMEENGGTHGCLRSADSCLPVRVRRAAGLSVAVNAGGVLACVSAARRNERHPGGVPGQVGMLAPEARHSGNRQSKKAKSGSCEVCMVGTWGKFGFWAKSRRVRRTNADDGIYPSLT